MEIENYSINLCTYGSTKAWNAPVLKPVQFNYLVLLK